MILVVIWFTHGYNYYGMMNSWMEISENKKVFEHNILASCLALISKICALIICCVINRKIMPLMMLQLCTAISYFVLASIDFEKSFTGLFLVHVSTFFITASFSLIWVITPESFPIKYRTTCTGIFSGAARLG